MARVTAEVWALLLDDLDLQEWSKAELDAQMLDVRFLVGN